MFLILSLQSSSVVVANYSGLANHFNDFLKWETEHDHGKDGEYTSEEKVWAYKQYYVLAVLDEHNINKDIADMKKLDHQETLNLLFP
jgi:hypothetical protein